MNDTQIATTTVVAVLLADGWHRIVPGSFSVGTMSFEAEAGPGTPGFRFEEEAGTGHPYRPATLAGPLGSIIAVRQVTPARRLLGDPDRPQTAHHGQRADQVARLRVRAS